MGNVDVEHEGNDFIQKTVQIIVDSIEQAYLRRPPSIYKVRDSLRSLSHVSFNPRVVCIGPLNRDKNNVQAFEEKKATYLTKLLRRLEHKFPLKQILGECVKKVKDSIEKIQACYKELDTIIDDVDFVKMMVMDACFILEFIYEIQESFSGKKLLLENQSISYDLVLLENQIPFFVLDDIFQCTILKLEPNLTVIQFIGYFLVSVNIFGKKIRTSRISTDLMPDHILALLHTCYKPRHDMVSEFSNLAMHSAVELDRAGVNFKPNQDRKWAMAMKVELYRLPWYWGKPTLRMPVLRIHHFTESVLRNLIAYEQSSTRLDNYITSYAMAMDMLVNTQDDIAKLVQSKVIVSNMSSNEEAANMMNNICKDVPLDFFYDKEWKMLDNYYNHWLPKNIARFKRTYFSSPWNVVALFAGIVLFVLTVVQTIFTVKSAN